MVGSKHTGHSWLGFLLVARTSNCLTFSPGQIHANMFAMLLSDVCEADDRIFPDCFVERDKSSFLAIGKLARDEAVSRYTVCCLGLQSFIVNRTASARQQLSVDE